MIMESIDLLKILAAVLALGVAIIGHEIMHGFVAYMYGDTTAKNADESRALLSALKFPFRK